MTPEPALTALQAKELRRLWREGRKLRKQASEKSLLALARRFGISRQTALQVVQRKPPYER